MEGGENYCPDDFGAFMDDDGFETGSKGKLLVFLFVFRLGY